jgi:hypothetical protein
MDMLAIRARHRDPDRSSRNPGQLCVHANPRKTNDVDRRAGIHFQPSRRERIAANIREARCRRRFPCDRVMRVYPDLEDELARTPRTADAIVVEERSGEKYKERRVSSVLRAICVKAGLPKDMTFTGFRHGGITEVGSVSADVRPTSGHATLDVTRIYNKATAAKAREIAAARRAHIVKLGEDLSESVSEHVDSE